MFIVYVYHRQPTTHWSWRLPLKQNHCHKDFVFDLFYADTNGGIRSKRLGYNTSIAFDKTVYIPLYFTAWIYNDLDWNADELTLPLIIWIWFRISLERKHLLWNVLKKIVFSGDVCSGSKIIMCTDYNNYVISWGCVKESVHSGLCDDYWYSVKTRNPKLSQKYVDEINKKLYQFWGTSLSEMSMIPHSQRKFYNVITL